MRSGYTLFEVICVVTVLAIVGALSAPLVKPLLSSNQAQAASDLVRSRWTEMRTRAQSEGRPYRFAIMDGTGKFKIAPDTSSFWDDAEPTSSESDLPPWVVEETLPGQVTFVQAGVSASATSSSTSVSPGGTPSTPGASGHHGGGGVWNSTLTFLPNGTAREDVEIAFGQGGMSSAVLRIRGRTGTITSGHAKEGKRQ